MGLALALVLIPLTGFFSGSETALYRGQWIRLTTWAARKAGGAGLALRLLNLREQVVVATLVGTNLCSVFAAMLSSEFVATSLGPEYTGIVVVAVVVLTLVFGEFLPKAHAQARPNYWLRRAAVPLAASGLLFAPAVVVLTGLARLFAIPFAKTREHLSLTRQDFLSALRQRERESEPDEAPGEKSQPISSMVSRLFRLKGMMVAEALIPIEEVESVPEGASEDQIRQLVEEHGFSRIPVYRGIDRLDITGVVFAKDLLAGAADRTSGYRVRRIQRVKERARVIEVLERMQKRGTHIAVVEDESGAVSGIVTLEDILEELVGEIRSET
jgi:putative hemolysin